MKVHSESDFAILAVTDTGQGIPPESVGHIIERFYRAEKSALEGNGTPGSVSQIKKRFFSGRILYILTDRADMRFHAGIWKLAPNAMYGLCSGAVTKADPLRRYLSQ